MSDAPGRVPGVDAAGRRVPLVAWHGPLYCHAPAHEPFNPAALGEAGDHADRWCRPGEPTAYLAGDPAIALAELARHHRPADGRTERRILRLEPSGAGIGGLVDVRDAGVRRALRCDAPPVAFLDRDRARDLADRVRADPRHLGIIVPSMAFLDDPARCNVVLFADRLGDLAARLRPASEVARLLLDGA